MGSYFLQLVIAKVLFSLAFELARPTALIGVVARQGVTRSKYLRYRRAFEGDYDVPRSSIMVPTCRTLCWWS